jgi:glycerol-3-phosphate O-acyltransferase
LDYLLRNFDPNSGRDLVFIPVGINYDRVLEDRSQLLALDPEAKKKSRLAIIKTTLSYVMHNVWLMLRGGWHRFGYAVVNFGTPMSMREYVEAHGGDFRGLQKEVRIEKVHRLAQDLMRATARMIPVVPVSLIAHVFVENPDKIFSELEIKARVQSLFSELEQRGVHAYVPRSDRDYAVEVGMRTLVMRHLVLEEDDLFRAASQEIPVLRYYANSIAHLLITDDVKTAESA